MLISAEDQPHRSGLVNIFPEIFLEILVSSLIIFLLRSPYGTALHCTKHRHIRLNNADHRTTFILVLNNIAIINKYHLLILIHLRHFIRFTGTCEWFCYSTSKYCVIINVNALSASTIQSLIAVPKTCVEKMCHALYQTCLIQRILQLWEKPTSSWLLNTYTTGTR